MILHICSFLDTSMLLGLSLVCKRFNEILKKSTFIWKARINRISPYSDYPLLQPGKVKLIAPYALNDHSFCK